MSILSIQSSVAYGHVGNSAAVFPLQRLGFDVWPVSTVHFSNHAGYDTVRGPVHTPWDVVDIVRGVSERGALKDCQAVLSGYLGDADMGRSVEAAVNLAKNQNPDAIYCCDPVMGDEAEGLYVKEDIPDFIQERLLPNAHIVTPNKFELDRLTGETATCRADVLAGARRLLSRGPQVVAITSLRLPDSPTGMVETLAVGRREAFSVTTPWLTLKAKGTGDAFAALFLGYYLQSGDLRDALSSACSALYAVIEKTAQIGAQELRLVSCQDLLICPNKVFPAAPLS